jgi:hypothetical protein
MFANTISNASRTLRSSDGTSIIVGRLDRAEAKDEECNRRNGAAGAVNSENFQSLASTLGNLRPSISTSRITLQPQIAARALRKSRSISVELDLLRRLVKAGLQGSNHIEIILNLI